MHREANSKEREAKVLAASREVELDKPGAIETMNNADSSLADATATYLAKKRTIGRSPAGRSHRQWQTTFHTSPRSFETPRQLGYRSRLR